MTPADEGPRADEAQPAGYPASSRAGAVAPVLEYAAIAAIAIVVAVLALAVFDDQVAFVLSLIGGEIDRAT